MNILECQISLFNRKRDKNEMLVRPNNRVDLEFKMRISKLGRWRVRKQGSELPQGDSGRRLLLCSHYQFKGPISAGDDLFSSRFIMQARRTKSKINFLMQE